jgi:hypothetical protein
MSEPMSDGSSTSAGGGAAGNATTILVLGIVGILCCNFLGPIAWYMGKQELQGITEGRIRASNEGTARAGMILGIIGTAFLVLGLLWLFFFGGMAILGAVLEQ